MYQIKAISYNIHSGIGRDRHYSLDRILKILESEEPDVIALQEVDNNLRKSNYDNQPKMIADALNMNYTYCITKITEKGEFGIATLSRFKIQNHKKYDLSYRSDIEPRGICRLDLKINGRMLHVYNIHLGLRVRERKYQRKRILSESILLDQNVEDPKLILGDFNDRIISVVHGKLRNHFQDVFNMTNSRDGSTFKWGPVRLRLDHIYISDCMEPVDAYIARSPLVNVASDHQPLVAILKIKNGQK